MSPPPFFSVATFWENATPTPLQRPWCLDPHQVYKIHLATSPQFQWSKSQGLSRYQLPKKTVPKNAFWSLPHGGIPTQKSVTLHPEWPDPLWILQCYGYGPCLEIQGDLLQALREVLPWSSFQEESDVLHAMVLYLATHHGDTYHPSPAKIAYTCADESDLNAHCLWDKASPDLHAWLSALSASLDVHWQNGRLMPITSNAEPFISILIPFRDAPELLSQVFTSLAQIAPHSPRFEVIGINNQSQNPQTLQLMQAYSQAPHIRFIDYDAPFNYAAMINKGVQVAQGNFILQLNNDIEFLHADSLVQLVEWASLSHIGAVGSTLLYPDGRIQHTGCHLGLGGHIGHLFRLQSPESLPPAYRVHARPVAAVTGALLMMRKSLYLDCGGMNAKDFQIGFNDMDLCLKVREAGFRNICLSKLHAIHYEGVSRKKNKHKSQKNRERQERKTFYHRHAKRLSRFDTTLSRGFDMREDFGQPSRFLWKSPLTKRLFTGRLPYTRWRFSLFQSADYALHTLWDKIPKNPDAKEPPS